MKLRPPRNGRRVHSSLPPTNARTVKRQRKEDVGVTQYIVIEEIACACLEVRYVESPALEWDGYSELALLIALAMERLKAEALLRRHVEQRTRYRQQRR